MIEIRGMKCAVTATFDEKQYIENEIVKRLQLKQCPKYKILRRSIDARKKPVVYYIYTVGVYCEHEEKLVKKARNKDIVIGKEVTYQIPTPGVKPMKHHPLIVGAGPSGLFCGLLLAKLGYAPVIIERGLPVEKRSALVQDFFDNGKLNPNCNVQFGEGGAGTFSDGKLNTQVKDKYGRIRYVLESFVKHGANPEILYDYKPHIGTDVLVTVVSNLRKEIESYGGCFLFDTQAVDFEFRNGEIQRVLLKDDDARIWVDCDLLVLAIGHSARDTFYSLFDKGLAMQPKDFSMGVRVEHPAKWIQESMYGDGEAAKILPAAPYKLTHNLEDGRGVYSFCMCPGGYVVNASSEEGRIAVNGMSYSKRDGENSNSAIVVSVRTSDFGSTHPLAGIEYQRKLEQAVYEEGKGNIVVQRYEDFKEHRPTTKLGVVTPQIKGSYVTGELSHCLDDFIVNGIVEGMEQFGHKINRFHHDDVILSGVESRTSSPVRIPRDDNFHANITGVYPCGEGAGYAGGIMSAAMDGLKVAEAIISKYQSKDTKASTPFKYE